jgi:hypothetical protein
MVNVTASGARPIILVLTTVATLFAPLAATAQSVDVDHDGIPDQVEHQLLDRYRPFFAFAKNEDYRPADVAFYIRGAKLLKSGDEGSPTVIDNPQLVASPNLVLAANVVGNDFCSDTGPGAGLQHTCVSNLFLNRRQTNYRINPLEHPPGQSGGDPGRHGAAWADELQQRNIGLYGHVVPVRLNADIVWDCHTRWDALPAPTAQAQLFYKVEYWQFFGYNSQDKALIGDHEGDWTSVQLLIKPATPARILGKRVIAPGSSERIVAVMMYAHGLEFRYDLKAGEAGPMIGEFMELRGPNYGHSVDIALKGSQCDSAALNAQQNVLRLSPDPGSRNFVHPVVYVERGGHESWPTTGWSYYGAQNHNGDGLNFLVATPPNLGEVEAPMTEYATALPILRFNGLWGAFSRYNTPPPGPPLHAQWTYPGDSSIGWLLTHRPY